MITWLFQPFFPADVRIIRTYIVRKKSIYKKKSAEKIYLQKNPRKKMRGIPWNTNALTVPGCSLYVSASAVLRHDPSSVPDVNVSRVAASVLCNSAE